MNPFPSTILSPTTANRIPRSPGADDLVAKLLAHGINAAAFLMDEDLLAAAEARGFKNDLDRALLDLIRQLPAHVVDAIFAPPPEPVTMADSIPTATGDDDEAGGGSMREGIAPPRHRRDDPRHGHSMGL